MPFWSGTLKQIFPFILLLILCAGASSVFGQPEPDQSQLAEAYLAKQDTDGKAGEPATDFIVTDVPIYCVVRLVSPETTTVRMDLVAVAVSGVKAESKVVSTNYTTRLGETIVNFTGKPHGNWVVGKYRADITIGNKLVASLPFDIKAGIPKKAVNNFVPPEKPPITRTQRKN